MHISDGIISGEICAAAGAAALIITAAALKKTDKSMIPRAALVTAGIFAASLVHIRIGPASAHLVLNGLAGILLGVSAFPAIVLSLAFQALMFQHGGMTTLGINALSIGLPALAASLFFHRIKLSDAPLAQSIQGGIAAALAVLLSGALMSFFLLSGGEEFRAVTWVIITAHIPVALIEGGAAGFIISFLLKVKPEMIVKGTREK